MPTPVKEAKLYPQDTLEPGDLPFPDPYNIERLQGEMGLLGFRLSYSAETPTTMAVIRDEALAGNTSPLVALTDHQTQGVGREGRIWHDTPGEAILMSVLVQIHEPSIATYTDLVALQICQALRETLRPAPGQATDQPIKLVKIKWPNDIVYDDKKVGGILVEHIENGQGEYVATIVGIGINVHQEDSQLPPTDYGATSLDIVAGKPLSREDLVLKILMGIRGIGPDAEIIEANPASKAFYDQLWRDSSSLLDRTVEVSGGEKPIVGIVTDTQIGQGFVVETPTGEQTILLFDTKMTIRIVK